MKTTKELLDMMQNHNNYNSYFRENTDDIKTNHLQISRVLSELIAESPMTKAEIIMKSGIEQHYAYQILKGTKIPSRDKVIMFCIGLSCDFESCQQILKITGYPQLYAKNLRDNIIIYSLKNHKSMFETNEVLFDMNLQLLY